MIELSQGKYVAIFHADDIYDKTIIQSSVLIDQFELIDLSGRIITTAKINDYTYDLDVSDFPSGLYLIKVFADGSVVKKKLIVH